MVVVPKKCAGGGALRRPFRLCGDRVILSHVTCVSCLCFFFLSLGSRAGGGGGDAPRRDFFRRAPRP